jgi:hypothetical protein
MTYQAYKTKPNTRTENKKHNNTTNPKIKNLQLQPQSKDGDILDDNHRKLRK